MRLFDGYAPEDLLLPRHRDFLIGRLLEEGDRADLRWLCEHIAEAEIRDFFHRHAARRLSARSRAFWRLLLGTAEAGAGAAEENPFLGSEIWPLA